MERPNLVHFSVRVPPAQAGNAQAIMGPVVRSIAFLGFTGGPTCADCQHFRISVARECVRVRGALQKIGCIVEETVTPETAHDAP